MSHLSLIALLVLVRESHAVLFTQAAEGAAQHIALQQVPEALPPGVVTLHHHRDRLEVKMRWQKRDREAMKKV